MQKLYGIKSILLGLVTISISLSGMETTTAKSNRRHVKRSSIDASQQEQLHLKFIHKIAQENNEQTEALQQENTIIWYTQVTSQHKTTANMPHPQQSYCPII